MKSLKKGFTLVELMVVIVIIGILAALAIPRFLGATNKTKATEFKPVLKQIYTLQKAYEQEKDTMATSLNVIGFDPPGAGSRFSYSVPAARDPNVVGKATYVANKGIKDLTNTDLDPAKAIACVDTSGLQKVKDATLGNLTNLDVSSGCK